MKNHRGRKGFIALCVIPAAALFTIFMIIPTIQVFWMSMFKWSGYSSNKLFVGFDNFTKVFADERFIRSFQNSILLIVVVTIITLMLALVFASLLTREKLKGQNFFRVIFYIPNILSVIVIAAIFNAIYDPNQGLLNSIINLFKGESVPWLGDPKVVVFSLVGAMVWQAIGYYMVMYMASMSAVPESIYESASLDGAGRFRQFFSLTLPLIWNNIRTTLTFFIISTINLSFLFVTAMTSGGPDGASEVFLSYMYRQAYTNSSYGYGMAIGVVVFLFSFALAAIVNAATKREVLEY